MTAPPALLVANHAFDCIGAKAYGMRTIFIDRRSRPFGETPHQPDLIVEECHGACGGARLTHRACKPTTS